ncbi:MAG: MBL fold metallo-hydrolase [Puniceicoccales bacterium]|jgi:beta-lactamase superfamily II metal-dependent hydrolase|nr:MBL fold metallo-hydrolase [Puniceicoccales bacterium]
MKMLLFLRVVGVFICGLLRCFANQLDVYFFNVGQASFTLLKTDERVIVIDCGTKRKTESEVHENMKAFVSRLLGSIKPIIFISHMDADHFCGLKDFFPEDKRQEIIIGGLLDENSLIYNELSKENGNIRFFENKIRGKCNTIKGASIPRTGETGGVRLFINDNDKAGQLEVACFFPRENKATTDRNEQSLMIKVTYAGKNILFPGDCSGTLFGKLAHAERFSDFFSNIDVFVFSHHGDGHNGEFDLYTIFQPPEGQRVPLFAIISSNPEGVNREPLSIR